MPLALVTDAGRANSIAAGIVPRLEADGWEVVTSELDSGDYPCDLSDAAAATDLIERISHERGPVSGLVLSHAHDVNSGILDTTAESFDQHLAVNARASLLLIAGFARQAGRSGGAIVAFTSDHTTGNLPYGASKGALDRLVISAARELGPRGISANVVNPGPIDTGWMDDETRTTASQLGTERAASAPYRSSSEDAKRPIRQGRRVSTRSARSTTRGAASPVVERRRRSRLRRNGVPCRIAAFRLAALAQRPGVRSLSEDGEAA